MVEWSDMNGKVGNHHAENGWPVIERLFGVDIWDVYTIMRAR